MTQTNDNGNRLDRIEAIMVELATASIRHDNTISRHDEEFSRINSTIERNHEINQQAIANLAAGQEANRQAIANLTASIQELSVIIGHNLASFDISGNQSKHPKTLI